MSSETSSGKAGKRFTRDEVEKENGKGRTLIILHDKVYDVSSFLNEHPGGEEVLLEHGGKDGSDDFDDVGHSNDAFEMMSQYLVGEIVESEKRNNSPKKAWTGNYNSTKADKYVQSDGLPAAFLLFAGAAALLLALAFIIIYDKK